MNKRHILWLAFFCLLFSVNSYSQINASFVYKKQSKEPVLIVENKDAEQILGIFNFFDGLRYSSTVTVLYSKDKRKYHKITDRLREEKGVIEVNPGEKVLFTFPHFFFLKEKGFRYFKISYEIVYAWSNIKETQPSCKGELEFDIKEP